MESINKESLQYLVGLGQDIQSAQEQPQLITIDGETFVAFKGNLTRHKPAPLAFPDPMIIYTLDGLIRWILADTENRFKDGAPCTVNVMSPTLVRVYSPAVGHENQRHLLAEVRYDAPQIFFNRFYDSEELAIDIMSKFVETANRSALLSVIGNMTDEQSCQTSDDGFGQRVTVKHGVNVDTTIIKNPVYLRPLRTFTEVEQPESPFALRLQEGGESALFECDGGAWKTRAVHNIACYLEEKLKGTRVVIIA